MRKSILLRINAIILAVCLIVSAICYVQILRVYANEEPVETFEYVDNEEVTGDDDWDITSSDTSSDNPSNNLSDGPDSNPEPPEKVDEVDPFDYNLTCYTPNINLGTHCQGDYIEEMYFSIVNIGNNTFPVTWDEFDSYTAFDVYPSSFSDDTYIDPGEQLTFCVEAEDDLPEGDYYARYVFYSANDIRQHHIVQVNVTLSITKQKSYITGVEVVPDRITISQGKNYKLQANVYGKNDYDNRVIWSITGNSSSGTRIDADGNITIGNDEGASTLAAIATSIQDSTFYNSAIISIQSIDHVVSIEADPSNGGAIAGGGAVKNGGSTKISASPNNNYKFIGWYEGANLISTSPQVTLNDITSDRRFVAKFERGTCYVRTKVNNTDGGTVTGSSNVNYGDSYTITAQAKNGYRFTGFVENNKTISTDNSIQLSNITSDREITAVFERVRYNVYVLISPADTGTYEGGGTYDRGSKVVLKYRAYDGYEFAGWILNGQVVSYDQEYIINSLENDFNITASFRKKEIKTYKLVSGITNEGGVIVPSGDYIVQHGGSVTYNIVPNANYKVKSVFVDGNNIGAVGTYTFNNISGAHTIAATFEKIEQPAAKQTNTQQKAVSNKTEETKKNTEYNKETANKGAVPEQKIVVEDSSKEAASLEDEIYAEDTYLPAEVIEIQKPVEAQSYSNPNSIIARNGLDEETVKNLIHDNAEMALLKEAYESGMIRVTVNNTYAENSQETSEGLYVSNPSITNFETVVSATLTEDEKFAAFAGSPILFNVSITENTETIDSDTKALMNAKVGYKPFSYFDFFIMKSIDGNTQILNRTGAELVVVLPIPEKYRKANRKFTIIRNHNGTVDVLADLDDNPDTITFKTDKFSEYSIAYQTISVDKLVIRTLVVLLIVLFLVIVCCINLWIFRGKTRRESQQGWK